jgi:hypothetical protein
MRTKMYRCKRSCMPEKCKVEVRSRVGRFGMTIMIADAEHVFTGEDTSSKEESVSTIAKSSYEGIFFDFDFDG